MRRPKLQTFVGFVQKYHNAKQIGLKMLYRDFHPETEEEKVKFRQAWDAIAKEIKNAPNGKGNEGESRNGENLRQGEGAEGVLCVSERGDHNGNAPAPQEEETLSEN